MMNMLSKIEKIIRRGERFLIATHVRPDGDAIGSALALRHILSDLGKEVLVLSQDKIPDNYLFLPGAEGIVQSLEDYGRYEVCFVLDCGDLERVGSPAGMIKAIETLIIVDHHLANGTRCDAALIDSTASSTAELIHRLFNHLAVAISPEAANCLYTAMLTDTGGFRYASTSRETMLAAGDLIGRGADPQWISENIYENNSPVRLALLARVLKTLEFSCRGRVGSLEVTGAMLAEAAALPEHTEGFVDIPRSVKGVLISILYSELPEGQIKVSLRSKDRVNVEAVARVFGGGGHLNAASCRVEGGMAQVKGKVLEAIGKVIDPPSGQVQIDG